MEIGLSLSPVVFNVVHKVLTVIVRALVLNIFRVLLIPVHTYVDGRTHNAHIPVDH